MGDAKKRGTFDEKMNSSIERKKKEREDANMAAMIREANMTPEEKRARRKAQMALLMVSSFLKF